MPEPGLVTDLAFNALVDWLSPVEFDASRLSRLKSNDRRLRATALLAWEAQNAVATTTAALAPLKSFFTGASARDKAARLLQYLCKLVVGVLTAIELRGAGSAATQLVAKRLKALQLEISRARRTFRMCEVGPLLTLTRLPAAMAAEPFPLARLCASVASAGFNIVDRVRWLREHGALEGEAKNAALLAARLQCFAFVASAVRLLLRAASTAEAARLGSSVRTALGLRSADRASASASVADASELRKHVADALRSLLCAWQAGHVGKLPLVIRTHDAVVGLMGVLTSARDLVEMRASS